MKSFSDLGIILGDSSPVNISKFVLSSTYKCNFLGADNKQ